MKPSASFVLLATVFSAGLGIASALPGQSAPDLDQGVDAKATFRSLLETSLSDAESVPPVPAPRDIYYLGIPSACDILPDLNRGLSRTQSAAPSTMGGQEPRLNEEEMAALMNFLRHACIEVASIPEARRRFERSVWTEKRTPKGTVLYAKALRPSETPGGKPWESMTLGISKKKSKWLGWDDLTGSSKTDHNLIYTLVVTSSSLGVLIQVRTDTQTDSPVPFSIEVFGQSHHFDVYGDGRLSAKVIRTSSSSGWSFKIGGDSQSSADPAMQELIHREIRFWMDHWKSR